MKKILKIFIPLLLSVSLFAASLPASPAAAYSPPVTTVRVGLAYNTTALAAANLQNYAGHGSGFDFGYFGSDRSFVSVGAFTEEQKITILIDRNMSYNATLSTYTSSTTGDTVVGCFHLRFGGAYEDYESALAASADYADMSTFIRYSGGSFFVLAGSYTSSDDAKKALSELAIENAAVDDGSSDTLTVVKTGTNKILFELDGDKLGVMPRNEEGADSQTWFKGYRWRGGFQYARLATNAITVVNFVNIEDYIKGVIPYEMSAVWPVEALKAQAICARTYIIANLNKHKAYGFDCCNTTDCQVYYGCSSANTNSDTAVNETAGCYLMCGDELCITYYHSCDGGWTEDSENIWLNASPYLRAVEDIYEPSVADKIANYNWTKIYTGKQLADRLESRGFTCGKIVSFEILELTDAGNVYKIRLTDENGKTFTFSKENCRTVVGANSQRYSVTTTGGAADGRPYVNSSASKLPQNMSETYILGSGGISKGITGVFYAITGRDKTEQVSLTASTADATFTVTGAGSGHNVGMSQWGAYAMAKNYGKTCQEILSFYFRNTEIVKSD